MYRSHIQVLCVIKKLKHEKETGLNINSYDYNKFGI